MLLRLEAAPTPSAELLFVCVGSRRSLAFLCFCFEESRLFHRDVFVCLNVPRECAVLSTVSGVYLETSLSLIYPFLGWRVCMKTRGGSIFDNNLVDKSKVQQSPFPAKISL